jgi:hypothetical protein
MHDHDRHPVFEFVVFGTALVMAVVLAYYSWQRFAPRRAAPAAGYSAQQSPDDALPDVQFGGDLEASDTVSAVGRIPPVEGSPRKKRSN